MDLNIYTCVCVSRWSEWKYDTVKVYMPLKRLAEKIWVIQINTQNPKMNKKCFLCLVIHITGAKAIE